MNLFNGVNLRDHREGSPRRDRPRSAQSEPWGSGFGPPMGVGIRRPRWSVSGQFWAWHIDG